MQNDSFSHLAEIASNNSLAILASQIVLLATQLTEDKSESAIIEKLDNAVRLVKVAKTKITADLLKA